MENELQKLDLQGGLSPMNFVRTKLALEKLEDGERLEVILDGGDAMLNVPRNMKEEGHRIVKVEPLGEPFRVVVEKGNG